MKTRPKERKSKVKEALKRVIPERVVHTDCAIDKQNSKVIFRFNYNQKIHLPFELIKDLYKQITEHENQYNTPVTPQG